MSFNGSGTFVINTAGQPVVPNTVISSTAFNALTADLANGLSTCITKDGQTTPTANIPMGNNKITGLAAGTAGTDAANLSQVQGSTAKLLQSVTGTDTITAAMIPALTTYTAGQMFYFVAAGNNTGPVTINIDSLGAKSVTRDGSTALVSGDIVSGEIALIVYDGTRFQLLNGNSFTNLNVSGTLAVGSTSTFTGAATFTANPTLSGGTASGVVYLNASKVATSGSALAFDGTNLGIGTASPGYRLDVVDGGGNVLRLGNGTAQVGSFISAGLPYLGSISNHSLALMTNSVERARLDTSGNLGLGVTPSAWKSGARAFQSGPNGYLTLWEQANGSVNLGFGVYEGSSNAFNYTTTGDAPTLYSQLSGAHKWFTAPSGTAGNTITFSQAMTLDANANLALNTTTNKVTGVSGGGNGFTVAGGVAPTVAVWDTSDASYYCNLSQVDAATYLWNIANGFMSFGTNNTERGRFTAGGDFGIGNSNPLYRLTVDKDTTSALSFFTNSNNSAPNGLYVDFSSASPNNATQYFLYCEDSTAQRATIRSDGGLANYQTNDVNLSDERVKTDIAPLGSMWAKIKALEVVTFKYKDQTHDDDNIGLIAQQVEAVAPEFVDADGWGETPEDGVPLKSIYTADMYHGAIKALQEAMARIESLEAKVSALEAK